MYIFISHSSKEAATAKELCDILEANGSECFLAPRNIRSGYEYAAEIVNGIDRSDALILLLSNNAINSPHVLREIERAVSKSIPIIVYKLEEVELSKSLEYFLMTHQWLNAENGNYEHVVKCIDDLKNNTDTAISTTAENSTLNTSTPIKKKNNRNFFIFLGIIATIIILLCISIPFIISGSKKSTDNSKTTENGNTVVTNIKLGDSVIFGKYNGANIAWNIINISDDGKEAVLLAKNILTFKAYTGAENGNFGYDSNGSFVITSPELNTNMELQASVRGNSNWDTSDIRTWLNSDKEYVEYDGYGPISNAMADHRNAYNLESGFLYGFSNEEIEAIKKTTLVTKGNALSGNSTITTTDLVFLLSKDELKWLENAKVALFTSPTEEAISKNESFYYKDYCLDVFHTTSCLWWLREPIENSASECLLVSHGAKADENFYNAIVSVEEFGIRPAITVDLTSDCIIIEK